jgi:TolB protein
MLYANRDQVSRAGRHAMSHSLTMSIVALVLVSTGPTAAAPQPLAEPGTALHGRIVFQRVLFGRDRIAIFTVRPDGTDVRRLTYPPRGVETGRPDWSPDGRRIAYIRAVYDGSVPTHIFVMRADGSDARDLSGEACIRDHCVGEEDPAWSPDGDRLALTRQTAGPRSIFVMSSDGTHRRRVTRPPSGRYGDLAPSWAPDGKELVFTRSDDARGRSSLFVVAVDGSRLRRITAWSADVLVRPEWSPDGRWIVFSKEDAHGLGQLRLIHPDGTGLHTITHSTEEEWVWPGFSPDGTMITAVRILGEASENDIYVMSREGTGIHVVTASLSRRPAEGLPDWG